ncbi:MULTISPECIES: ribonuclease R [unclassified Enterococcus]|uniref:ribonuclease R n=1 Tax=unclassified Enterococcus TaxID=2608891 RepID=UPI0015569E73|nr:MULTISPECIES: ribonuclease R [unclassified Enterococcus]MBS7577183.1 ribonuclease R [Enterococcus sp. MMGLQ5-2]MBS7584724.1 ribonuclease R [Enterococcus sp. MMGLQ5-1]NPD12579.1 ribonuclease R [Enterococcus sp. MMGLQ5-1]NPD37017.1 ribonuclease R [Enterococcus sp. MMGLQ5-2]
MKINQTIIKYLKSQSKQSVSMEKLAIDLKLNKANDFKQLVQAVANLERDGKVEFKANGKVALVQKRIHLTGTFRANQKGFGFISVDPEEPEIYVAKEHTMFAMDGDQVAFVIIGPANTLLNRGAEGEITSIIERKVTKIIGIFSKYPQEKVKATDLAGTIKSRNRKLPYLAYVENEGLIPEDQSLVSAVITYYPDKAFPNSLQVKVTEVLAAKDTKGIDVLEILESMSIPIQFQQSTMSAAEKVPEAPDEAEYKNRLDLRASQIVTIDGADAKDLDDAVQVSRLENGNFELGVHIADVSYYVKENEALDKEAFERGTSVYVTDRVVPMLPERLSNGICSLNPRVPRLTMTCLMEIDRQGQVVRYRIDESVIETNERMTYDDVNAIFEGNSEQLERYQELVPMFNEMKTLHHILEKKRQNRGALNFDTSEAKIIVDADGTPVDIKLRERGTAERMIESFMLAANETVAEHFSKKQLPFIYRIHEHPKMEKLTRFFNFASMMGETVKGTISKVDQHELQSFLENIKGSESEVVLSTMLLRSMQQAKYAEHNEGHFGLAAEFYTHFTSPIRRYPDLIVHRMIRYYKTHQKSTIDMEKLTEKLTAIALQSSQRERRSVDAEREVEKIKKAEYMANRIGEAFIGVVSSVTRFGFFVELPNTVEGMVHISNLNEYYNYQEQALSLVGEKTGRVIKIGQKVKIELIKSDAETGEIDFKFIEQEVPLFIKPDLKAKKSQRKADSKTKEKRKTSQKTAQPFYKKAMKKKKGRGKK